MSRRTLGTMAGILVALLVLLACLLRPGEEELPPPATSVPPLASPGARAPSPPSSSPTEVRPDPAPEPPPAPPPAPPAEEDAVVGRVVSAAGLPVAGAEVLSLAEKVVRGESGAAEFDEESRIVFTGEDGRFRHARLRRDLPHALRVRAPGHGGLVLDFEPRGEGPGEIDLGDLVLPAPRAIHGVALERPGEPLAGATVKARGGDEGRDRLRAGKGPAEHRTSFLQRETATDDAGRFRFGDLAPGEYLLHLEVTGGEGVEAAVTVPADRDPEGVELVLDEGNRLTLVFVDESGSPVAGQLVTNSGPGALREHPALWTDAEGRVVLRGLPSREMRFTTRKALPPGERPRFAPEEIGPVVPVGQEIRVVLHPPSFLRGRVLDEADQPVEAMQINPYEGDRWLSSLTVFSGKDGGFEIAVAAGRSLDLRVEGFFSKVDGRGVKSGMTCWRGSAGPAEAPAEGLILRCRRIPADRSLRVRVVDPDGAPLRGVFVQWDAGEWRRVETGADGLALCDRMVGDRTWISAWVPPGSSTAAGLLPPEGIKALPEGQEVEMRFRRGVPFTVRVRDAAGTALAGAQVTLDGPVTSMSAHQMYTGGSGDCTFAIEEGLVLESVFVSWKSLDGKYSTAQGKRVRTDRGEAEFVVRPLK